MASGESPVVRKLENELAAAITDLTRAMNEQFHAVMRQDPDIARFEEKIDAAIGRRSRAKDAIIDYINRRHVGPAW